MSLHLWQLKNISFLESLKYYYFKQMISVLATYLIETVKLIPIKLGKEILSNTYSSYKSVTTSPFTYHCHHSEINRVHLTWSVDTCRTIVWSDLVKTTSNWTFFWGFCRHSLPVLWGICKVSLEIPLMFRGQDWAVGIKGTDFFGKKEHLGLTGVGHATCFSRVLGRNLPFPNWVFMSWENGGEGMVWFKMELKT